MISGVMGGSRAGKKREGTCEEQDEATPRGREKRREEAENQMPEGQEAQVWLGLGLRIT